MKIKTRYGEYDADMELRTYANGRTAIQLYDDFDGTPLLTATVNVPNIKDENVAAFCEAEGKEVRQFLTIKDYSENEGVYDSLVKAGVIEPTPGVVPCGYTVARVAFLKEDLCT